MSCAGMWKIYNKKEGERLAEKFSEMELAERFTGD